MGKRNTVNMKNDVNRPQECTFYLIQHCFATKNRKDNICAEEPTNKHTFNLYICDPKTSNVILFY